MDDLYANIRLRPTRIGFLVRPTDLASVRKIMRVCVCLWGGIYNPIIPVFRTAPKEWRRRGPDREKGLAISRGYVQFFEPDAFVESEKGLVEEVGLEALREKYSFERNVLPLDEFLTAQDGRDWSEPALGLCITDVLRDLYEKERKFSLREDRPAVVVSTDRSTGLVEAIFGAYPRQKDTQYIAKGYEDVFEPTEAKPSPETWLQVFQKGATTPLRVTGYGLNPMRSWYHDQLIYIFDPSKATDLIDLWNLRLEPQPVLPIPVGWFPDLVHPIRERIIAEHRPVRGNSHGVMHKATIEISRSIADTRKEALVQGLKDLPPGVFSVKYWRTPVWIRHVDDHMHRDRRLEVTHKEHRSALTVSETTSKRNGRQFTTRFEALEPDFAQRLGGHGLRWVNAANVSSYGFQEKIATVFPFNALDRRWPRLGMGRDHVIIGSEGWIFGQKYKNSGQTLCLLTRENAIIGSLRVHGIEARLSEPGYIAQQMLDHLGGLWGVHILKDLKTLRLLNCMAGGVRRRKNESDTIEETFERRSAPVKDWTDLISRRQLTSSLSELKLSDFTDSNVIRLGLETDCSHCQAKN